MQGSKKHSGQSLLLSWRRGLGLQTFQPCSAESHGIPRLIQAVESQVSSPFGPSCQPVFSGCRVHSVPQEDTALSGFSAQSLNPSNSPPGGAGGGGGEGFHIGPWDNGMTGTRERKLCLPPRAGCGQEGCGQV